MAGLNKNRKPVAGLTTKNCQLISGRGTKTKTPRHSTTKAKLFCWTLISLRLN